MSEYKTGYRVQLESGYTYWTMSGPSTREDVVYLQKFVVKSITDLQPGEEFFWGPLSATRYKFIGSEYDVFEFDYTHVAIKPSNKIIVSAAAINNGRIHDEIDVLTINVNVFVPLSVMIH